MSPSISFPLLPHVFCYCHPNFALFFINYMHRKRSYARQRDMLAEISKIPITIIIIVISVATVCAMCACVYVLYSALVTSMFDVTIME